MAALLSFLIKEGMCLQISGITFTEHPDWDLTAFCYGCPPVFSLDQARKVTYIRSIICNTDIIPRLSYGSLYDLKARIKAIIEDNGRFRAKLNKVVNLDRM